LSHILEELGLTYSLHLLLVGKLVVDFLFVIIELFRLRRYKRKSVECGVFRKGGSLWAQISDGRASPTNHCWCQKTRVTAVSSVRYQNILSASFSFVTDHACVRQTDRQTDRQNYDSQDRATIATSRGKRVAPKRP